MERFITEHSDEVLTIQGEKKFHRHKNEIIGPTNLFDLIVTTPMTKQHNSILS